jgi:hypothetical protein
MCGGCGDLPQPNFWLRTARKALDQADRAGVTRRDVKPQNIMLTSTA